MLSGMSRVMEPMPTLGTTHPAPPARAADMSGRFLHDSICCIPQRPCEGGICINVLNPARAELLYSQNALRTAWERRRAPDNTKH